jgi:hypothetical protein
MVLKIKPLLHKHSLGELMCPVFNSTLLGWLLQQDALSDFGRAMVTTINHGVPTHAALVVTMAGYGE